MRPNTRIKKIIHLLDNLFCKRDYDRFGIELLEANGFEVSVWDLTPIINPDIYNNFAVSDPIEYKDHKIFCEVSAVRNAILNLGNDCFIIIIYAYCPAIYPILRLISRKYYSIALSSQEAVFHILVIMLNKTENLKNGRWHYYK